MVEQMNSRAHRYGEDFRVGDMVRVRPNVHYLDGKLRIGDLGFVLDAQHPNFGVGHFQFPLIGDFYLTMESVERVVVPE